MAASIKYTYMCPRCDAGISSVGTITQCPNCNLIVGSMEVEPYQPPYTLCEQHEKYKNGPLHLQTVLELEPSKAVSILNDGLCIIEMIGAKKGSEEDIRNLLEISIRIGRIAQRYKGFLEAKGLHVPDLSARFVEQETSKNDTKQEKTDESTETPGTGETPTAPE